MKAEWRLRGKRRGNALRTISLVAEQITAVIGSRKLAGPGWQLAVERPIERAERLTPFDPEVEWSAVLGIRRDLKLLVSGVDAAPRLLVAAWAGEPGDASDGVAVVERADGDLAVARIPRCGCGDRGCGNAGIQLRKSLPAGDLPALVALLRVLPWSSTVPDHSDVLRGEGLAALPVRRTVGRSKLVYHGLQTRDGVLEPRTQVLRDWPTDGADYV